MTSRRLSRWRNSAILDFRGPIMGSLKSPCTTSYRSSIETVALNCFVSEKIAFLQFGDRQTNERTNRWTRPSHEAALAVASGGLTSSSAVAKRPRDASCLSVSFNSIQNVEQSLLFLVTQSTELSLRAITCCSVVFGVTLKLLVINISSSFPAINKLRCLLSAISATTCGAVVRRRRVDNTWPIAALTARSEARWLRIAISAYLTCIRRPVTGVPFGILPCRSVWKNQNGSATRQ